MLAVLVAHIIITFLCLWWGHLFYSLIKQKDENRPIIYYLFSGVILLTLISQIIVLYSPISSSIQLILFSVSIVVIALKWKDALWILKKIKTVFAELSNPFSLLFIACWLLIILFTAGPTMMDDTESYHIQSIKWIQEFGSVPGLVNLHERFGFNSSWFSSVAFFSFSPNEFSSYTVLNGLISAWFCFWLIHKSSFLIKSKNYSGSLALLFILAFCFTSWPMIRGNSASTNYDFIATYIVFILFTEMFFSEKKVLAPGVEWLIWPIYLFTVRIINFPLLFLSAVVLFIIIKEKKLRSYLLPISTCLLLTVPFIIRNLIISGYPFYPAMNFDWFQYDWKADVLQTEKLLEYIKYYNRVPTTFLEIEQTKALGAGWIPSWFRYLFLYDKLILLAGVAGLLIGLKKFLLQKVKTLSSPLTLLLITIFAWLICWFFISPDPRFVYGALLAGILILSYTIFNLLQLHKLTANGIQIASIIFSVLLLFYTISKPINQEGYRNWINVAILPQPPYEEFTIESVTFRIPKAINNNWNARCYGTALPCIYKLEPGLKPRGNKIKHGFRIEK